jgi:hypothetical protein
MPKECLFCMKPATLTGEHIHSDWMNKILPGKWQRLITNSDGLHVEHDSPELNWKVKVVCESCNSGWMSEIEAKHAQPVMSPLILGQTGIPISQADARSIALFAFKTAVIIDGIRTQKGVDAFYSPQVRATFRNHLGIPPNVNMWMCAYVSRHQRADVSSAYYKGSAPFVGPFQFHVCTYSAGSFAFQLVSLKGFGTGRIVPEVKFDHLSVPFSPSIPRIFVWPPRFALRSIEEFNEYHRRWERYSPLPE